MPAPEILEMGELGLSAVQVIAENAVEVVIDEERTIGNQERRRREHVIHRDEQLGELAIQFRAVSSPLPDAALAELPLFEPGQHDTFNERKRWDDIAVVDLEADPFEVIFDVAGQDGLNAFFVSREQAKFEFAVDVARDLLSEVGEIGDGGSAIDQAGNCVGAAFCCANNGIALLRRDVLDAVRNPIAFEDAANGDAKRRPGKLDECDHGW